MASAWFMLIIGALSITGVSGVPFVQHEYHNYEKLTSIMMSLADTYEGQTHLYSIGKSVQGRDLWVMAIAGTKPDEIVLRRPNVKYIGNMHGNEVVGREILLQFIEYLLVSYENSSEVQTLLDNTRLHVLPSMNPDGFEEAVEGDCDGVNGRYNALNFDLNRNFPDFFEPNGFDIQPETEAIMDWIQTNQFVFSANFHGGSLVASYPFDNIDPYGNPPNTSPYSTSPDDDLLRQIALTYAQSHPRMQQLQENKCDGYYNDGFVDGITNGADWYLVKGGMQDYNYIYRGCVEITIEVSCCKYPNVSELPRYWEENRLSMMAYLQQVHRGVKGMVIDHETNDTIEGALVSILGQTVPPNPSSTTALGEYWKLLLAGTYDIQVSKAGYASQSKTINVTSSLDPDDVVILDFTLASAAVPIYPSTIAIASLLFFQQLFYSVDNIFE